MGFVPIAGFFFTGLRAAFFFTTFFSTFLVFLTAVFFHANTLSEVFGLDGVYG